MKTITQHITERLQLTRDRVKYEYFPKTKKELKNIIQNITSEHENDKVIDLNMIDTSKIEDMSDMFIDNYNNYDISQWDVSNVRDMSGMFFNSEFNNDISKWDVSQCKTMFAMFSHSFFNKDISKWDVSNVREMKFIFTDSKFNQDLTQWKTKIQDEELLKYIQDYIK